LLTRALASFFFLLCAFSLVLLLLLAFVCGSGSPASLSASFDAAADFVVLFLGG